MRGVQPADAGGVDERQAGCAAAGGRAGPRRCAAAVRRRRPLGDEARAAARTGTWTRLPTAPSGPAQVRDDRRAGGRTGDVGTAVTMSASTGQTSVRSSALTSVLLPCLNSPTTATGTSSARSRVGGALEPFREIGPVDVRGQAPGVRQLAEQAGGRPAAAAPPWASPWPTAPSHPSTQADQNPTRPGQRRATFAAVGCRIGAIRDGRPLYADPPIGAGLAFRPGRTR